MNMKRMVCSMILLMMGLCGFSQELPSQVEVKNLQGKKIQVEELVASSPVIFTFWATWCKPCQSELEALTEISEKWAGKVKIVAVSIDDSRATAKVRSLVKGRRWSFEVVLDVNKELYKALNLTSVPFAMIVDQGKIVYTHVGYSPGDEKILVGKALSFVK